MRCLFSSPTASIIACSDAFPSPRADLARAAALAGLPRAPTEADGRMLAPLALAALPPAPPLAPGEAEGGAGGGTGPPDVRAVRALARLALDAPAEAVRGAWMEQRDDVLVCVGGVDVFRMMPDRMLRHL